MALDYTYLGCNPYLLSTISKTPSKSAVAVVVLLAHSNRLERTAPLVRDSIEKVHAAGPGEVAYLP